MYPAGDKFCLTGNSCSHDTYHFTFTRFITGDNPESSIIPTLPAIKKIRPGSGSFYCNLV